MPTVPPAGKPQAGLHHGNAAGSGSAAVMTASSGGITAKAAPPQAPPTMPLPKAPPLYTHLHRSRILGRKPVVLHSDTVPECGCRPDWANGGRGCDPESCLNAAVRIECTPGHCACGDACSNQRMQRSQNAPTRYAFGTQGFCSM